MIYDPSQPQNAAEEFLARNYGPLKPNPPDIVLVCHMCACEKCVCRRDMIVFLIVQVIALAVAVGCGILIDFNK